LSLLGSGIAPRTICASVILRKLGSERAHESGLAPASVAEVVRLYGLRMRVEQSYKQVKHVLDGALDRSEAT
jgi:hypothetical protein